MAHLGRQAQLQIAVQCIAKQVVSIFETFRNLMSRRLTSLTLMRDMKCSEVAAFCFLALISSQELLLPHNNLKTLPASMAEMAALKRVDLSNNTFEAFPRVLTRISCLEQINVAFNMLSELPATLIHLKHLKTLLCLMNRCKVGMSVVDSVHCSIVMPVRIALDKVG